MYASQLVPSPKSACCGRAGIPWCKIRLKTSATFLASVSADKSRAGSNPHDAKSRASSDPGVESASLILFGSLMSCCQKSALRQCPTRVVTLNFSRRSRKSLRVAFRTTVTPRPSTSSSTRIGRLAQRSYNQSCRSALPLRAKQKL